MTTRGVELLDRLALAGDETVLDAGCGTGQVTEELLRRLPRGHVVALDGSARMLQEARARLGGARIEYVKADLERPLPVAGPFDAVVSTSTFHWVKDHDGLFAGIAARLRPGGTLLAEFGGAGNIATVLAALAELGHDGAGPWNFATPADTERRLRAAGFAEIELELVPRPATIPPADLERYLRTVVLGSHLAGLAPAAADALVRDVARRLPAPEIDYVRLNVLARRG